MDPEQPTAPQQRTTTEPRTVSPEGKLSDYSNPDSNPDSNPEEDYGGAKLTTTAPTPRLEGDSDSLASTPLLKSAIEELASYEFNPDLENQALKTAMSDFETAKAFALLLSSNQDSSSKLPEKLETGEWPYKNKTPDPVNIAKAVELLANAYRRIDCDLPGAASHGYAWIIEDEAKWKLRKGTSDVEVPERPARVREYNMKAQFEYREKLRDYERYKTLAKQGVKKILEWFGKSVFYDLFERGTNELPPDITPRKLIEHLKEAYGDESKERECVEAAIKVIQETAFNPKSRYPVEECCLTMKEAQMEIELLGRPYDDRLLMDAAIGFFRAHYPLKDIQKAEARWYQETTRTWEAFGTFWKKEIRLIRAYSSKKKYANEIEIEDKLEEIVRENEQLKQQQFYEYSRRLQEEAEAHSAHTAYDARPPPANDEQSIVSAMTSVTTDMKSILQEMRQMNANSKSSSNANSNSKATTTTAPTSTGDRNREMLQIAKNRDPKDYKHLNNGNGKYFESYCWKCGVNTSHWTRGCRELSHGDRQKYRAATHLNTMGGSTKYIERWGKSQKDYNFDSL